MSRLEPVLLLLTFLLLFSVICMFVSAVFFPNNGAIFASLAGLMGNASGALFMRVKSKSEPGDPDHVDVPGPKLTVETPASKTTVEGPQG